MGKKEIRKEEQGRKGKVKRREGGKEGLKGRGIKDKNE